MRALRISIVSTTPRFSRKGNRVTAVRWARLLGELGHRVRIEEQYRGGDLDLMIALHAKRSFSSVQLFRKRYPTAPLILALTGTDLYRDIRVDTQARRALGLADRLIVLQPLGAREVPANLRHKVRVVLQSARFSRPLPKPRSVAFEICVLAHLRPVKDPFRAALASRLLPPTSRARVLQVGAALNRSMQARARAEMRNNPRYRWLGELPRSQALKILARSQALVLSSLLEGGANVVTEAIVAGTPVLASKIPGSVGLLGADYPGYFRPRDTRGLARLLRRVEKDPEFLASLREHCAKLEPLFRPERERATWGELLNELCEVGDARWEGARHAGI